MPADVLEAMGFPPKVRNAFAKANPHIAVIGDVVALTPTEVMRLPGIGPIGLRAVETILKIHKLALADGKRGDDSHG